MSMNKKESAALATAIDEARIARALRWSDASSIAPDVPKPVSGQTEGWTFNAFAARVDEAWSGCVSHGTGKPGRGSGTQGGIGLYSTRTLALKAMRCEMERRFAKQLADIDRQIAEETR